ncbi:hypothetical protein FQA47_009080 [Oryzias melastigma]|uniref:Secreted protein n=1 Tax=Oryzias melastigma TaxID=30732 RepID=A0A834C643_ORYME|nr:hypothetical protein FQA47_009080 [Oryzias melastigma]
MGLLYPKASLSKKLLQLLLVLFCDGNALVRSDIHMATGRGEGKHCFWLHAHHAKVEVFA